MLHITSYNYLAWQTQVSFQQDPKKNINKNQSLHPEIAFPFPDFLTFVSNETERQYRVMGMWKTLIKTSPTYSDALDRNLENPGVGCGCGCGEMEIALPLKIICLHAIVSPPAFNGVFLAKTDH